MAEGLVLKVVKGDVVQYLVGGEPGAFGGAQYSTDIDQARIIPVEQKDRMLRKIRECYRWPAPMAFAFSAESVDAEPELVLVTYEPRRPIAVPMSMGM